MASEYDRYLMAHGIGAQPQTNNNDPNAMPVTPQQAMADKAARLAYAQQIVAQLQTGPESALGRGTQQGPINGPTQPFPSPEISYYPRPGATAGDRAWNGAYPGLTSEDPTNGVAPQGIDYGAGGGYATANSIYAPPPLFSPAQGGSHAVAVNLPPLNGTVVVPWNSFLGHNIQAANLDEIGSEKNPSGAFRGNYGTPLGEMMPDSPLVAEGMAAWDAARQRRADSFAQSTIGHNPFQSFNEEMARAVAEKRRMADQDYLVGLFGGSGNAGIDALRRTPSSPPFPHTPERRRRG